jgi:hypothetical protein
VVSIVIFGRLHPDVFHALPPHLPDNTPSNLLPPTPYAAVPFFKSSRSFSVGLFQIVSEWIREGGWGERTYTKPEASILVNLLISATVVAPSIAFLTLSFSSLLNNLPALPAPAASRVGSTPGSNDLESDSRVGAFVLLDAAVNDRARGLGRPSGSWNSALASVLSYSPHSTMSSDTYAREGGRTFSLTRS